MGHSLVKTGFSCLLLLCISILGVLTFSFPAQAFDSQTQPYFIKSIEKDKVLVVSPNFQGPLTQTSLLPSLTEISENYHIKATRAIEAEKLNGKLVPGLIVYVEARAFNAEPERMLANKL